MEKAASLFNIARYGGYHFQTFLPVAVVTGEFIIVAFLLLLWAMGTIIYGPLLTDS